MTTARKVLFPRDVSSLVIAGLDPAIHASLSVIPAKAGSGLACG